MHYGNIKFVDTENGPKHRTSLFVSGCTNKCKGCFQPQTWDFCFGKEFTKETEDKIIEETSPSYIDGITILGGDPCEPENQRRVVEFLRRFKKELPDKTVWMYTGFIYERLAGYIYDEKEDTWKKEEISTFKKRIDVTDELLSMVDVLVDGPFIEEEKDFTLLYRGSKNQRLIDMNETRKNMNNIITEKDICLWNG